MGWWGGRFHKKGMENMLEKAKRKLTCSNRPLWATVTGPARALIATVIMLSWNWTQAAVILYNVGNELVFGLDPPTAFFAPVKASVRRWRLARILKIFPHFGPAILGRLRRSRRPYDHYRFLRRDFTARQG